MSVVKGAMLLLLLAVVSTNAAPGPEDCDGLNVTIPAEDLHKVTGDWVVVWAISYPNIFDGSTFESCHATLQFLPDNTSMSFIEWNRFANGSCSRFAFNMTVPTEGHILEIISTTEEMDGVAIPSNDTANRMFFKTCEDCMTMFEDGNTGKFLFIYRRKGTHLDMEKLKESHDDHKKLAGCLGMPTDTNFIYKGAREFSTSCPIKG